MEMHGLLVRYGTDTNGTKAQVVYFGFCSA